MYQHLPCPILCVQKISRQETEAARSASKNNHVLRPITQPGPAPSSGPASRMAERISSMAISCRANMEQYILDKEFWRGSAEAYEHCMEIMEREFGEGK